MLQQSTVLDGSIQHIYEHGYAPLWGTSASLKSRVTIIGFLAHAPAHHNKVQLAAL